MDTFFFVGVGRVGRRLLGKAEDLETGPGGDVLAFRSVSSTWQGTVRHVLRLNTLIIGVRTARHALTRFWLSTPSVGVRTARRALTQFWLSTPSVGVQQN